MSTAVSARDPSLSAPLTVWHVVGPMNHGGTEVMIMELLRHKAPETQIDFLVHQRRDHVSGTANFDSEITARGSRLIPILTPTQSGLLAYFRDFATCVQKYGQPDVIHVHLNARSGLVVMCARLCGIKRIIVHAHAALTFRGSLIYRAMSQVELALSKLIIAVFATDYWGCSRDAIASLFARWPWRGQPRVVIKNAIDVDVFSAVQADKIVRVRESLSGGRPELLIGTVGRIVRHKNAIFLLAVLAELRSRGNHATLVIVGREEDSSYCSEIRAHAEAMGLSDRVQLVGERNDIAEVMAALDVFASPALREGFGIVGLEAQAAGTPAVLSTGFPSNIDMRIGLVQMIEKYDANTWADAIETATRAPRPDRTVIAEAIAAQGFSARENTRRIELALRDPSFRPGEVI